MSLKERAEEDGTPETTVYRGERDSTECSVTVDGEALDPRYDLLSASPQGFEWGYGGSGPAQLAVAILAEAYSDEFAVEHHQRFKRTVVANLPEQGWRFTGKFLDGWRNLTCEVTGDGD
jgi:hypothetical protein